jgi:hypothetical protein
MGVKLAIARALGYSIDQEAPTIFSPIIHVGARRSTS